MEQGSREWLAERIGRVTSTSAKVIINPRATPAGRLSLMGQLVREVATADYKDVPTTFWMRHGREMEPEAIAAYVLHTGRHVSAGGFSISSRSDLLGDSPDGIVGFYNGCIEAKCPDADNHGITLVKQAPYDDAYLWQMAWHVMVGEVDWCDYVSYNATYPEHLRLFIKRYTLADFFPEIVKKGRKYKTKEDEPDTVITTAEQVAAAWQRVFDFETTYQQHLSRLGLTL